MRTRCPLHQLKREGKQHVPGEPDRSRKSAFLGLAQKVVHADGLLAPREAQFLSSLEVTAGEVVAAGTVEDLAAIFQTRQSIWTCNWPTS